MAHRIKQKAAKAVANFDVATFINALEQMSVWRWRCGNAARQMGRLLQCGEVECGEVKYFPLYFEVPFVELGFEGIFPNTSTGDAPTLQFVPTHSAIVQLSVAPFVVVPLNDMLLVWFDDGEHMCPWA